MRFLLGLLSGLVGLVAGWAAVAAIAISLTGSGHDGGGAMAGFFQIGPIGGLAGFVIGAWLFAMTGIARKRLP